MDREELYEQSPSTELQRPFIQETASDDTTRSSFRRILNGRRSSWWILDAVLVIIILLLLVERQLFHTDRETEVAGDLTGFVPKFSRNVVKLKPDLRFVPEKVSEFWSDEVQDKWLSIVPRGLGYVRVDDPSTYRRLPQPIHDYTNMTVFTTSMPHQLHCLYNILAVYAAITSTNPHNIPTAMTFHLQHCFEYLRLNIMCSGDIALEGAETTFPPGFGGSDGWDAQHVCKNYDEIYSFLDKHRASDRLWIL